MAFEDESAVLGVDGKLLGVLPESGVEIFKTDGATIGAESLIATLKANREQHKNPEA